MNKPIAATDKEIQLFLENFKDWTRANDNKLERVFALKSYFKGLSFLQTVGWLAQKTNHHPDMELSFSQLRISLTTHDIGNKISNLDLAFAELVEKNWF
jgi:4a-hydroxytetrahydrobiopterin dehydratase